MNWSKQRVFHHMSISY